MMIANLLKEAMAAKGLSARQVAKITDISHTTVDRILTGDWIDLETLVKLCNWLKISPATALNTLGNGEDQVVSAMAALIEVEPRLAETLISAARDVENGKLQPSDLRDIVAYATYKVQLRRNDEPEHQFSEEPIPEGGRVGI